MCPWKFIHLSFSLNMCRNFFLLFLIILLLSYHSFFLPLLLLYFATLSTSLRLAISFYLSVCLFSLSLSLSLSVLLPLSLSLSFSLFWVPLIHVLNIFFLKSFMPHFNQYLNQSSSVTFCRLIFYLIFFF